MVVGEEADASVDGTARVRSATARLGDEGADGQRGDLVEQRRRHRRGERRQQLLGAVDVTETDPQLSGEELGAHRLHR